MKSEKLLDSFCAFCVANPTMRFWQALRNWCGHNFILAARSIDSVRDTDPIVDTFYWNGRTGQEDV